MATAATMMMIAETSFMAMEPKQSISLQLLKVEAIDRLYAVVDSLPKYKQKLDELIAEFKIDDMLYLMNTIYRDDDFKCSVYYQTYNDYFDEIEDLLHRRIIISN